MERAEAGMEGVQLFLPLVLAFLAHLAGASSSDASTLNELSRAPAIRQRGHSPLAEAMGNVWPHCLQAFLIEGSSDIE